MSKPSWIVLVSVAACLGLAPAASAAVVVDYRQQLHGPPTNQPATAITVTGNAEDDDVTITQQPDGSFRLSRDGGVGIAPALADVCLQAGPDVTCDPAQAIGVDLKEGNDRLSAPTVTVPVTLAGGIGNDRLTGGVNSDVLAGGAGEDTLDGGPGVDEYFGEADGDTILSRDGAAERISCGEGPDVVDNDFTDIIAECERGTDKDGDGFTTAVDCNDLAAGISPGAPDVLENGVDEDCDGKDDVNLDRDGDGFAVPLDCNDADKAIRPGTFEIRGNKVDENCDQRMLPLATLPSLVSTRWRITGSTLQLVKLIVRNAPKDARVSVTCDGPGCTFGKRKTVRVKRDLAPVRLHRFFGKGRLRPGARVVVRITAPGAIGRLYRYKLERNVLPSAAIRCLVPGSKRDRAC